MNAILKSSFKHFFERISSIGHSKKDDYELKGLKTVVTLASYFVVLNLLYFSYLYMEMGREKVAMSLLAFALFFIVNICMFALHKRFTLARDISFIGVYLYIISYHLLLGGYIGSSGYINYAIVVICAANIFYSKGQWFWLSLYVITAIILYIFEPIIAKDIIPVPDSFKTLAFVNDFIMISILVFFAVQYFTSKVREEKSKSDTLIHNILPKAIVNELNVTGTSKPIFVDKATIFFADFVGFTSKTEELNPEHLVRKLSEHFSEFDRLLVQHKVEKLKTIGDGYMAVGGLPIQNNTHPIDVGCVALKIIKYLEEYNRKNEEDWNVRIGIHVGPMIAGIIGQAKFSYDVWGDSVNLGSRIETASLPGRVCVSQQFVELTSNFFEFEPRGLVRIKHKAPVAMYYLKGLKANFSEDGFSPNAKFYKSYNVYKLTNHTISEESADEQPLKVAN